MQGRATQASSAQKRATGGASLRWMHLICGLRSCGGHQLERLLPGHQGTAALRAAHWAQVLGFKQDLPAQLGCADCHCSERQRQVRSSTRKYMHVAAQQSSDQGLS